MKVTIQGLEICNAKWGPIVGVSLRNNEDELYQNIKEAIANGNKVFLTNDARVKKAHELIANIPSS